MPAKELTPEQKADAVRLKSAFDAWKAAMKSKGERVTQESAAVLLGFGQSATSQYLNGVIPLNPEAAAKFSALLGCRVADISPDIDTEIRRLSQHVQNDDHDVEKITGLVPKADESSQSGVRESGAPTIPTTMPYSPSNLHNAILLLGSLLGALDQTSREIMVTILSKLALDPDGAADHARRAVANASVQGRMVADERLNRALTQTASVETVPGFIQTTAKNRNRGKS